MHKLLTMKVANNDPDNLYSEPSKFSMVTLGQDELKVLLPVYCEQHPQHKDKLLQHGLPNCARKYSYIIQH